MNPTILGFIGPGSLNQVPTLSWTLSLSPKAPKPRSLLRPPNYPLTYLKHPRLRTIILSPASRQPVQTQPNWGTLKSSSSGKLLGFGVPYFGSLLGFLKGIYKGFYKGTLEYHTLILFWGTCYLRGAIMI